MLVQTTTGYRVEVVTVRKLEFETDAFAFGDKVGNSFRHHRSIFSMTASLQQCAIFQPLF